MDDEVDQPVEQGFRIARRSGPLRREISARNLERSQDLLHETTYGEVPSVIYCEEDRASHGNFLPAVYRRICANPDWKARLQKAYTASRSVPRSFDRQRKELDCANSSDALLMNIFCYPGVTSRPEICALLGIESGAKPLFGFLPRTPLRKGKTDRTEIDMKLGELLVEAKLTEGDFQTARPELLRRYEAFSSVFDLELLPIRNGMVRSYQLIRGVLAAEATGCAFSVFCDARRPDLIEDWFSVARAVLNSELRSRLRVITWQEIAARLVKTQQKFLSEKYGIEG